MSRSALPSLAVIALERELRRARASCEAGWDRFIDGLPPEILAVARGEDVKVPRGRIEGQPPSRDDLVELERAVCRAVSAAARAAGRDVGDDAAGGEASLVPAPRRAMTERPPPKLLPLELLTDRRPVGPPVAPSRDPSTRREALTA